MYKNGVKCGDGYIRFSNGNTFTGWLENDKMNGQGIMNYKDGTNKSGIWKDDEIVDMHNDTAD